MTSPQALLDMRRTCKYFNGMPKLLQVRNVPDRVHRRLKARAADQGLSLSDFVLRELTDLAERPTMAEIVERLRSQPAVELPIDSVRAVRDERDSR